MIDTNSAGYWDDGYTIDEENGKIRRVDDTGGEKYDLLYSNKDYARAKESGNTNSDGNPEPAKQVKVNDTQVLPQLAKGTNMGEATSLGEKISGPVANTDNRSDAYNVFKFASENSNVEWSYQRYTDGTASVATANTNSTAINGRHLISNNGKTVGADIHSHPNATRDDLRPSGEDMHRKGVFIGINNNAKVQLYMPNAPNPNGRMLDLINNKLILSY